MIRRIVAPFFVMLVSLAAVASSYGATTLLPNGEQCFQNANGPLSSGSMNMYQPLTTIPKTTWKDSNQSAANTQPIQLDANGCAVIYGIGSYRQQVYDGPVVGGVATGNLVFDQTTTDTSAYNSTFWAGNAGGTPNGITIADPGFNATDGSVINFTAVATNTGPTTINPSGFGAITVVKDTTSGPVGLIGGEIVNTNPISVVYRASDNAFHILNAVTQSVSGASAPLCGTGGLKIVNSGTTGMTVTANNALMVSSAGQAINRSSVNILINLANNGINGLDAGAIAATTNYYIYLIDNGAAPAGLASLSSTAPTLPAGYNFVCRIAAWHTNGSSQFYPFSTLGAVTQLEPPFAGTEYSTNSGAGTCISNFVANTFTAIPTTARQAFGYIIGTGTHNIGVGRSAGAGSVVAAYNPGVANLGLYLGWQVNLTTPQTVFYCNDSNLNTLAVSGWVDSINAF